MIYVTSYDSPDIDGMACAIAYVELLATSKITAKAVYFGDLGLELLYVKKFTNYFPVEKHIGLYESADEFILVDAAEPDYLDPLIPLDRVKEIIDHHQKVSLDKFVNSKNQIEIVGSCATLITEKFIKAKVVPSKNAATYLYAAIVSNTVNFKLSITTKRDVECAEWLKQVSGISDHFVNDMFRAKSKITKENLYQVLFQDFVIKNMGNKKVGIAQIEMTDVIRMSGDLAAELTKSLTRLKTENNLDYIFFSGIDVIEGFNYFYTIDEESLKLFSKILGIENLCPGYKTDYILMRKQIWPKMEEVLTKKTMR